MQTVCPRCKGGGKIITNPCAPCQGQGRMMKTKEVEVDFPEGVDSGMNLRLVGQGNYGDKGGARGNLFVEVRVRPDKFFRREGIDVHVEIPITIPQAALGATISIPSLTGEVELQVPAGTQPDMQLLMRGKGVKNVNRAGRGHQYVHFKVQVPKKLSDRQRELLEEFAKESGAQELSTDKATMDFVPDSVTDALNRFRRWVGGRAGAGSCAECLAAGLAECAESDSR